MQEVQWAEHDARRDPVGDRCFLDVQTQVEAFPELTFEECAAKFHSKEEKVWKAGFQAARQVKQQLLEGNPAPEWRPPSSVCHTKKRTITTYFEVGFVTEAEVQHMTGSTSKDLRLGKPHSLDLEDGQSTLQGWFIKLSGLSPSDLAGVRRVRIESSVGIDLQEHLLVPGKQIQQDQGLKTFNFLSKVQADSHPSAYKPLNRHHTPSLETSMASAKATEEDGGAREGCHDVGINGWRVSHTTEL